MLRGKGKGSARGISNAVCCPESVHQKQLSKLAEAVASAARNCPLCLGHGHRRREVTSPDYVYLIYYANLIRWLPHEKMTTVSGLGASSFNGAPSSSRLLPMSHVAQTQPPSRWRAWEPLEPT